MEYLTVGEIAKRVGLTRAAIYKRSVIGSNPIYGVPNPHRIFPNSTVLTGFPPLVQVQPVRRLNDTKNRVSKA